MAISEQQLKIVLDDFLEFCKTKNNSITSDDMFDRLERLDLTADQIDYVYKVLAENNVNIDTELNAEKDRDLFDQIVNEVNIEDPVKMYLKDIGKVPLLLPEEIAEKMGISEERVMEIQKIAQDPVSLETPIGEEDDSHLGDFIEDDNATAPSDVAAFTMLKEQLIGVLDTLTPREEKVLRLRYGIDDGRPRTLEEVGKEFNVTRERIRQIEAKALRKLRHPSRSKKLKDFLE